VLYALIGTLVTTPFSVNHLFGSTLNNSKEADCRLVRIRENAEAIAFTGASRTRSNILEAFDNVKRLLIWN